MLPILATFVILLVFGIGDMVATKTKAIVSMLFLSSVIFLAGFWTKVLPNTMYDDSTLQRVSGVLVTMLLVHMGTTIKLRDFADQWKTVIIAAAACIAISLGIYFLGGLIVSDKNYVIVGAPILSGGVVATLTMQNAVADYSVERGVFAALGMVAAVLVGFIASRTAAKVGATLRSKLFRRVVSFSDAEVQSFSAASLITRGTNDIQLVQMVTVMLLRMVLYAPILAIGGIARKSPFVMQTMADVIGVPIRVVASDQACALGAAMFAAVAAGLYGSVQEAQRAMCPGFSDEYLPDMERHAVYDRLYDRYLKLGGRR